MANNVKTSDETAGGALVGTEEFRGAFDGANYKWTPNQFKALFCVTDVFTPVLGDGTNNYTLSFAEGYYAKLFDTLILWQAMMIWTNIGSAGASQLKMTGLPVASLNVGIIQYPAEIGQMNGINTTATLNQITCKMGPGSTELNFFRTNDNASASILPADSSSAAGTLFLSGHYRIA